MSERALSEAAMLDGLRGLRLPAEAAGGAAAELAAAAGLAATAALFAALLLRALSRRAKAARPKGLRAELAALAALPEDRRRLGLLRLLKARAPARFAAIRADLYRPGGGPDLEALEAEVDRLA